MMNYSDEILNAFVDGELEGPEKEKLKQDMHDNEQLAEQVRAICDLKKSLQSSYDQIPLPESDGGNDLGANPLSLKLAVFAILVLFAGFFLGSSFNHGQTSAGYADAVQKEMKQEQLEGIKLTPVNLQEPNKIILHVSSSDPEALYSTLYKVDTILEKYKENKIPFELEVVANSGGIDLFREDVSPYKKRIKQIMKNYSNVSFIACTNAIDKLRLKGVEADLFAETRTDVTAIEQIVKRLQEGWVYLKV